MPLNRWTRRDRRRRMMVDTGGGAVSRLKGALNLVRGWLKVTPRDKIASKLEQVLVKKLRLYPRDCRYIRVENRCVEVGTSNSVMRKFRRSRFVVRKLARSGELPGYRKASW